MSFGEHLVHQGRSRAQSKSGWSIPSRSSHLLDFLPHFANWRCAYLSRKGLALVSCSSQVCPPVRKPFSSSQSLPNSWASEFPSAIRFSSHCKHPSTFSTGHALKSFHLFLNISTIHSRYQQIHTNTAGGDRTGKVVVYQFVECLLSLPKHQNTSLILVSQ